jgi:hypothetical protein
LLVIGCTIEAPPDERLAATEEALATTNALTANALTANALYPNALTASALLAGALAPDALTPEALAAIQDPGPGGTLSRLLLKYTVGCALDPSGAFAFSWTDGDGLTHHESYPGMLGIAPAWATGPLDLVGQRMVSACIAARVNYYGTQVILSVRSSTDPLKVAAGSPELTDYPAIEGAFWGNLFTSTPWLNACYDAADVANSRQYKRECATGHLNTDGSTSPCGMIKLLGDCQSYCPKINGAGQYYQSCTDQPGVSTTTTGYVITTALP